MWQFGYEDRQWNIGTIVIFNDGTTRSPNRGNYVCRVYGEGVDHRDKTKKPLREGRIEDWPRQSRPVFELVIACLHACGYQARKKDERQAEDVPSSGFGPGAER
jgi:hypothetical protein